MSEGFSLVLEQKQSGAELTKPYKNSNTSE